MADVPHAVVDAGFASPVDVSKYGTYTIKPSDRPLYRFGGRISQGEAGRYHVYGGWFCPWSQRVAIARELAGLTGLVGISYVDGRRDGRGWGFREPNGPDPVNGFRLLREAYERTEPGFDGHVSVPTLWDRAAGRVASNDFRTIGIDLATRFRHLADPVIDTYPEQHRDEIERLDSWIGPDVNRSAAKAAHDEAARARLHAAFDRLEERLAGSRYLIGDAVTEADVRLFVTLVRHDVTTGGLRDHPRLLAYALDLHALPAFRDTTRVESFAAQGAAIPDHWLEVIGVRAGGEERR